MTVRDYLRVVRERRWLILALALLFTAAAYLYVSRQPDSYRAEARLEFRSQNTQSSLFGQPVDVGGQTPEGRAAMEAATLVRPDVLRRARRLLDFRGPLRVLAGSVDARPEARTNLVIVSATARTGAAAATIANAVARAAVYVTRDQTRREYARAAAAQRSVLRNLPRRPGNDLSRILTQGSVARLQELSRIASPAVLREEATAPRDPSSPRVVRTTLLGLLVGVTLGLVAAFFRDALDRRPRSAREVSADLGLPILGHVREALLGNGLVAGGARRRGVLSDADLEAFRLVRANLDLLGDRGAPNLLLVTSAAPGEGKSTVATGLAAAYASAGKRTLLVEADLRRGSLAGRLGVRPAPGLGDYLAGRAAPGDTLQPVDVDAEAPLVAIVAGAAARRPAELLAADRARAFFDEVRQAYDVVIVDSPPLLAVADTMEIAPLADAVVLCVRGSRTPRAQLEAGREALERLGERPVGVVVTGARTGDDGAGYGYYAYAAREG